MKNFKRNESRTIKSISVTMLIMVALLFLSCETEVPETDIEPPKITFIIRGNGIDKTFNYDEGEFHELNLTDGATYDFVYSVGDTGGLKEMSLGFDPTVMNIETDIPSSWTNATVDLGDASLSSVYSWVGDGNNPVTGNILTGKFKVDGDDEVFLFFLQANDYGGESMESNSSRKTITININ